MQTIISLTVTMQHNDMYMCICGHCYYRMHGEVDGTTMGCVDCIICDKLLPYQERLEDMYNSTKGRQNRADVDAVLSQCAAEQSLELLVCLVCSNRTMLS